MNTITTAQAIQRNTECVKFADHCWSCDLTYEDYLHHARKFPVIVLTRPQYVDRCLILTGNMMTAFRAPKAA